jgi:uncharacterized protein YkwD
MRRFLPVFGVLFAAFSLFQGVALAYVDVTDMTPNVTAISYFSTNGFIKGYEGDLFRPNKRMNRAEFLKVILSSLKKEVPAVVTEKCFTDVPVDAWYAPYVCYAKEQGYVKGYDGGVFKPGNFLTVGEAVVLTAKVFEKELTVNADEAWYSSALRLIGDENALPETFLYVNQPVTRGETVEMLWRLETQSETETEIGTQQKVASTMSLLSAKASEIDGAECVSMGQELPDSINGQAVRDAWLTWINKARADAGLDPYVLNIQLSRTATNWSNVARARGYIDHKRVGQSAYYDYGKIMAWFKGLGLTFQQVGRSGATENITWNIYSCKESDCTDELIKASREGFDYFMSEKGKAYSAHYDSIMSPSFDIIGVGIAVDEAKKKFYLTVHYGTKITSDPLPVCPNS